MNNYLERKQELLSYTIQSYNEALFAGTSGNLSTYDQETGIMVITPSSVSYATMTAEDMMVLKLDGTILEGKHRPSSEWPMHAEIYKAKQDIKAIVHTHSPYATSFAVSNETIPVILIEMVPFLGGDIQIAKFALPGTPEVGSQAIIKLANRNSCLLANHGVVTVGANLAQAHIRAVYVEDAAKIYSLAKGNGTVVVIPPEYVEMMLNRKNKN
jgi:ribulose-5-phosphate 4-epimerase/fuculose-1-phosphate aldolase